MRNAEYVEVYEKVGISKNEALDKIMGLDVFGSKLVSNKCGLLVRPIEVTKNLYPMEIVV